MDYQIPCIIPYDLLVDLDYGIIHFLSKKPNTLFTNIPNKPRDLIRQLINRDNINPLTDYIIDKDKMDEYYNMIMSVKKDLIIQLSPTTGIFQMVVTSIRTASESMKITVACKDELEKSDILRRLSIHKCSCNCIITEEYPKNIDKLHANIFLKDIRGIGYLPMNIELKNILIGTYRFNMEKEYISIPLMEYIAPYCKRNKILNIDIYSDVKLYKIN